MAHARLAHRHARDRGRRRRATSARRTPARCCASGSCRRRPRAPQPWICALALASDGLDGALARRSGPTRLGRDLEGLADAAFAAAALRGAVRHGWLGPRRGARRAAPHRARRRLQRRRSGSAARGRREARVLHAARAATPLRAAGLVAAGPAAPPRRRRARHRRRAVQRRSLRLQQCGRAAEVGDLAAVGAREAAVDPLAVDRAGHARRLRARRRSACTCGPWSGCVVSSLLSERALRAQLAHRRLAVEKARRRAARSRGTSGSPSSRLPAPSS